MGVKPHAEGTTVNAINNLALITGNVGRAGPSPFSITGQCNAMGTREAGFASAEHRPTSRTSGTSMRTPFSPRRGLAYPDIIEAAAGKIRALWRTRGRSSKLDVLKQALENLDFLVVQDGFHPTPTAELADLVLPPRSGARRKAPTPIPNAGVSKVNAAVIRRGSAVDFDILALAEQLGCRGILFHLDNNRRMHSKLGARDSRRTALRLLGNQV